MRIPFGNSLSLWIAHRLSLRGPSGAGTGVVTAIAGVALALMIMEFTLAIVTGFKNGIKDRLIGFDAQISILPAGDRKQGIAIDSTLLQLVSATLPQADVTAAIRTPGLIKTDNDFEAVVFLARDATAADGFAFERGNIVGGNWPDYSADSCRNDIVLSRHTARRLGLETGDKVYASFFVDGSVKVRRYRIAGLFESNFGDYDRTVAYASLPALQSVEGYDSATAGRLDLRLINTDSISSSADRLQQAIVNEAIAGRLSQFYPVDNVTRSGALYFNWLSLLDTNVTVIFLLMLAVAGLTLISSLFILILDRIPMIGTLRALGAQKSTIRRIFIAMAMRLAGTGMIIGNILGIGLLLVQKHTHIVPLDPEMYYLDSVPVEIHAGAFVLLNIGTAAVAWLILILPARLASDLDPASTISYR